jgi:hypothetical protein
MSHSLIYRCVTCHIGKQILVICHMSHTCYDRFFISLKMWLLYERTDERKDTIPQSIHPTGCSVVVVCGRNPTMVRPHNILEFKSIQRQIILVNQLQSNGLMYCARSVRNVPKIQLISTSGSTRTTSYEPLLRSKQMLLVHQRTSVPTFLSRKCWYQCSRVPRMCHFSTTTAPATNPKTSSTTNNSYLKIDVEADVLDELYGTLMDIKGKFDGSIARSRKILASRNSIDPTNQPLQIRPRRFGSMELILFSCGESFSTLPPDVLAAFHEKVVSRLDEAGYALEGRELKEKNIAHPDDFWFRVHEIKIFPPGRNNLLVATLQTSISWLCLYEDLQIIANKFPDLPHRETSTDSVLHWTPIIVLADIVGGTGRYGTERNAINTLLRDLKLDISSKKQTVSMGGRYPEQVSLEWSFRDLRKRPDNEEEVKRELNEEFWKVPPVPEGSTPG